MTDALPTFRDAPVVSIDFEGTSSIASESEPIEVAAVRFENGLIVKRFTTLLRPSKPIPAEATAIHGLTDADVANAPTLDDVAHELVAISDCAIPLGYNCNAYDKPLLHRYLSGNDVALFNPATQWIDVFAMAFGAEGRENGSLKLSEVCKRRGINLVGAHRAEADAIAAGTLFFAIMGASTWTMEQVLSRVAEHAKALEKDQAIRDHNNRERERYIWRTYAAAALRVKNAEPRSGQSFAEFAAEHDYFVESDVARACTFADLMLKEEKKRFARGSNV